MGYDSDLRNQLAQLTNMGSRATGYAQQIASSQQAYNNQQDQARLAKLQQDAQFKLQQQQSAQMSQQQKAMQDALNQIKLNAAPSPQAQPSQPNYFGPSGPPASIAAGTGSNTFGNFLQAISGQESGGNYGAVNKDSGALGKYQIMPGNIAGWSKAALGHSISAAQFKSNPQLQEAVAQHQLKGYYDKYGPGGAAVAWYAGEGTAQRYVKNPGGYNKPQGNYPSIGSYALSIMKKMGLR